LVRAQPPANNLERAAHGHRRDDLDGFGKQGPCDDGAGNERLNSGRHAYPLLRVAGMGNQVAYGQTMPVGRVPCLPGALLNADLGEISPPSSSRRGLGGFFRGLAAWDAGAERC
jgi:hypothetical protein